MKEVNPLAIDFFLRTWDLQVIPLLRHPGAVAESYVRMGWHSGDLTEFGRLYGERMARVVEAGGLEIGVFRLGEDYFAWESNCPHQGGPLGEGSIEIGEGGQCWLRCPWHGWDFDPVTGKPPGGYDDGVKTFVTEWNDVLIREACLREIKRGGQVYFVHNRVEDIGRVGERLAGVLLEAGRGPFQHRHFVPLSPIGGPSAASRQARRAARCSSRPALSSTTPRP